MAARAVVRDVGRVLGHPYGFVDRIAKLIPHGARHHARQARSATGRRARVGSIATQRTCRPCIDLARRLEGLARNAGTHAGGVVIAPGALTEFTPLYSERRTARCVTQLDKDDVEADRPRQVRLPGPAHAHDHRSRAVARDQRAARARAASRQWTSPRCRSTTRRPSSCCAACDTTAVFQLESRGMRDIVKRLQPDRFEDIVAPSSRCIRPGPLQSGMVDDFIAPQARRGARSTIRTRARADPRADLRRDPVSGAGDADRAGAGRLLRSAAPICCAARWARRRPTRWRKQRSVFVDGADARGVPESREPHLRPDGEVRRLRLQQVALSGLCACSRTRRRGSRRTIRPRSWRPCCLPTWSTPTRVVHLIDACREMKLGSRAAGRQPFALRLRRVRWRRNPLRSRRHPRCG